MRGRFALVIVLLVSCNYAHAVITAKTPLSSIEGSARYIFVGKVDKYFAEKPAMMVNIAEDIKGKAPFRQLPINLKVEDPKTFKEGQIEPLLKRFGPDMDIIFFVADARAGRHITRGFCNGTWFSLDGTIVDDKADKVVFALTSAEPFFRKSFKGTTEELRKILKDYEAKKGKLPALDDKIEEGFGPEYAPKKGASLDPRGSLRSPLGFMDVESGGGGHLFGVIPTIGLGAPLAILALLFPSIFGGVFVLFRQWMAFITLISLNSTLLILQWYLTEYHKDLLRGTWWMDGAGVWFLMTIFTFICAFWAWRRQLNALSDADPEAPQRTELAVLGFMAGGCIVTTIVLAAVTIGYYGRPIAWSDVGWTLTVVMTLGIVAGAIYRAWSAVQKPAPFGSMPLATEGVILCTMLLGHVAFVPAIFGGNLNTEGRTEGGQQSGALTAKTSAATQKWVFTHENPLLKGMFASSPVVDGDWIYASYSEMGLKAAALVKLDRKTGESKWKFEGKKGELKQMLSTPCLVAGKLYFGEGFHDDLNCKVYCVDANTGKEVWSIRTGGQTESSPAVANGKVYIGAGNEGIYCLDAKDGSPIWKYPDAGRTTQIALNVRLKRFGAGMVVVGDRLYCGSGVDRNQKGDKGETAVFCFNAETGDLIWKTPAPFPVWSTPVVKDGQLYVTSGSGDVFDDAAEGERGGALQCLDLSTGKEKWQTKFDNGVIFSPAIDAHRVYCACRDGQVYCVNRADGKERWRRGLGSPVIGTPVLDCDPVLERSLSVFAVSSAGKACCLSPNNGDIVWTFDLTDKQAGVITSPRLVVTRTADGYQRQLYFACGLGGGAGSANANEHRPVLYCVEDLVKMD